MSSEQSYVYERDKVEKVYLYVTHQLKCLMKLFWVLNPNEHQNSATSRDQDENHQAMLRQLQKLKEILRKQFKNSPLQIPKPDGVTVMIIFDPEEQPSFNIRYKYETCYPEGYPFFIDDNFWKIRIDYSEAIYRKIIQSIEEEEEEEQSDKSGKPGLQRASGEQPNDDSFSRHHSSSFSFNNNIASITNNNRSSTGQRVKQASNLVTGEKEKEKQHVDAFSAPCSFSSSSSSSSSSPSDPKRSRFFSATTSLVSDSGSKIVGSGGKSYNNNNQAGTSSLPSTVQASSATAAATSASNTKLDSSETIVQDSAETDVVGTSASTSTSSASNTILKKKATADAFLTSDAYKFAKFNSFLTCPLCDKEFKKNYIKQHIDAVHLGLKPFRCMYDGCDHINGYYNSIQQHVKNKHNILENQNQYISHDPVDHENHENHALSTQATAVSTLASNFVQVIHSPSTSTATSPSTSTSSAVDASLNQMATAVESSLVSSEYASMPTF